MKKHSIIMALGPLLSAFVIVAIILFAPFNFGKLYSQAEQKAMAANPLNRTQYIGYAMRSQALANKKFLPIIGSSELEKISPYHPSSFAMKYNVNGYTPYLIGQAGTQSLPQFFYIDSVAKQMKNRKIIFIISPQWFGRQGVQSGQMDQFTSHGAFYTWIEKADPKDPLTQSIAKRLLGLNTDTTNTTLNDALNDLADGKAVDPTTLTKIELLSSLWVREDYLFSGVANLQAPDTGMLGKLEQDSQQLPKKLDYQQLDQDAYKYEAGRSTNNRFQVLNSVWNQKFKQHWRSMQNYQTKYHYDQSPEFSDFQYVLNEFAKNHDQVEFVIPAVNDKWYRYTGLPMSAMTNFSSKIKYQLRSQGFNDIVDFTDRSSESYFMQDTIHFGARGWVAFDKSMVDFANQPNQQPTYKIDNKKFLSKTWQNQRVTQK